MSDCVQVELCNASSELDAAPATMTAPGHKRVRRSMNLGPRYLYKGKPFTDSVAERAALLASLNSAPGLASIDSVDGHHKGGHRVSLQIESARLDDFIKHMESQGWLDGF